MSHEDHKSHRAIVDVPGCLRVGPYSLAMQSDGIIVTSGQVGLDSDTRALVEGGFEPQARQVFRNLKIILEAAGVGFGDVLKANVFLTDILNFATLNAIYEEYFSVPYPARTTIGVASLPLGALVEIELIARACAQK